MERSRETGRREAKPGWERLLDGMLLVSVLMAFYTGFRMPSLWTINYFIPSVFDGFYRRSLVGSMLFVFGEYRFSYHFIVALQFVLLALLLGVLLRQLLKADVRTRIVATLLFLAPTGGYLFHEVGYVDQLLYLILAMALSQKNPGINLGLMFAALFVHEMAAFTIIPIYLADLVTRGERLTRTMLHGGVLVLVFCLIYFFFQTVEEENIDRLMQSIAQHGEYALREDYYAVFRNEFLGDRQQNYYRRELWYELFTAMALGLLIAMAWLIKGQGRWKRTLDFIAVLAACLAPLVLGIFGWDTSRWVFLSLSSSLVMLLLYRRMIPDWIFASIAVLLLAFVFLGELRYFDGMAPRNIDMASIQAFLRSDLMTTVTSDPPR